METKNATITKTMLGIEDHGILTCMVYLDYGDGGYQGFGGWALDAPIKNNKGKFLKRQGTAYGMQFIQKILEVIGVGTWEELQGKPCRVICDHYKVYQIGHYLKDVWFDPMKLKED